MPTPLKPFTGEQLLAWRNTQGITQAELGRALGMYVHPKGTCPTISKWESGIHAISESRLRSIRAAARRHGWKLPGSRRDRPGEAPRPEGRRNG